MYTLHIYVTEQADPLNYFDIFSVISLIAMAKSLRCSLSRVLSLN